MPIGRACGISCGSGLGDDRRRSLQAATAPRHSPLDDVAHREARSEAAVGSLVEAAADVARNDGVRILRLGCALYVGEADAAPELTAPGAAQAAADGERPDVALQVPAGADALVPGQAHLAGELVAESV